MKDTLLWGLYALTICLLTACASQGGFEQNNVSEERAAKTIRVTAYGSFDNRETISINQRWSKAQQAAKLEAYRNLADQIYNEPIGGQVTVGTQVMNDDVYRVYLDTYMRDAKTVDYRTLNDSLQLTMELNLSPRFFQCMSGSPTQVSQCLQDDKKLAITRLGYRSPTSVKVNLACSSSDCSDQMHVQGFARESNPVNDVLLGAGMYDLEWNAHTAGSLFLRSFLINELF
jgi:hypothetical protein